MLERFGLPRPQIATKLYGAIAATLAVLCVLAAATIQFASRTEDAALRLQHDGLDPVLTSASLERGLEEQRRLVVAAAAASEPQRQQDERRFDELGTTVPELMARLGYGPSHPISRQAADLTLQGALILAFARDQRRDLAGFMIAEYAPAMDELQWQVSAGRLERAGAAHAKLETIAASARSLITWVSAAAAACGLLIVPLGLLLLHRVLSRLEGIGNALVRLARNDTSVDIPGLTHGDEVGQLARSVAVFKAKSIELLQKKSELERLNLQLDVAINNIPLGLSMFDAQERLLVCNRRYSEMYDLPGELTQPGTVHCAHWDHREKQGARHFTSGDDRGEPDADGSMTIEFGNERIIAVARQPLQGGGWVALHEDVTHRRRQEQEITRLACHDPLTGLANRALFREQLQQSLLRLGRGQGFAVLCLDLDRFKAVNDTLGHPVGDALLKEVSARLLACVRQGDVVARLGGDEFAIIQANVRDPGSTEGLAARIVEAISKPYEIGGQRIDISASVGMTMAPRDGTDADQLMSNADLALYRVKADGRRGFSFFKAEMNDRIQMRRSLEADLRKAFENEELALCYQPLVSLKTQKVTGFETLMRWTHPKHGIMSPADFIGIAEEIGLIAELGEWALREACLQAARWSQPVRVSLNLSPLQLRRALVEAVLQALAASGLAPNRLELEVTESVLLQDIQNTLATLHQLRQLGVRIVMDDFGTGYCSLSYLRSFPFDKIKIDRGFIADIDRSEHSRAIVESIVGLGRRLGMATVAEGIENVEQVQMVRAFGCEQAQGYYFSPPIAPNEVERVLAGTFEHARSAA